MALAAPRKTEGQQVLRAIDEAALAEGRYAAAQRSRQTVEVEGRECLVRRQIALPLETFDATGPAILDLDLDEMTEVPLEAPAFSLGTLGDLAMGAHEAGQLERAQQQRDTAGGGCRHALASATSSSS